MKVYILLFALAACQVAPSKTDKIIVKDSIAVASNSDHKQDSVIQILQAEIALQNDLIYGIEKEIRTMDYYAGQTNDQLNNRLVKRFSQIDSILYIKRESSLGRFAGTFWKYLK